MSKSIIISVSIAVGADLLDHLLVDRDTGAGLLSHVLAVLLGNLVAHQLTPDSHPIWAKPP